nr:RNA-directed DNA polymerase, eukaryota [Tanacetum cinerariifolium]
TEAVLDELLANRLDLYHKLHELNQLDLKGAAQKAKVKWAIERDENSNFFHARFQQPGRSRLKFGMSFPNRLSPDQMEELDKSITTDEICVAVWDCGENKSPGPDGYTFEFYRRFWNLIHPDFCSAVLYFFDHGFLLSFKEVAICHLLPRSPKKILDGPFILNEVLAWCKRKNKQAIIFKVDFAKAYDSVRWDLLLDVLQAFGFGPSWCKWICGIFSSNMAPILVNGSPTAEFPFSCEFPFFCGLKQGDPLAPLLFIHIMESLHISVSRAANDGVFKGLQIQGSLSLSHLFYADDAIFIGEWSDDNLDNLIRIFNCFHLASGLKINVNKSQVLGVGFPPVIVNQGASHISCSVMHLPFKYLGVMVGDHMSRYSAWSSSIQKIRTRLSKWKVSLRICWRVSSTLLGGTFGTFGTG